MTVTVCMGLFGRLFSVSEISVPVKKGYRNQENKAEDFEKHPPGICDNFTEIPDENADIPNQVDRPKDREE